MAGFVDKFKRMWDAPDDEYQQEYDEYGYADENEEEEVEEQQPVRERAAAPTSKNKVVNINAKARSVFISLKDLARKHAQSLTTLSNHTQLCLTLKTPTRIWQEEFLTS